MSRERNDRRLAESRRVEALHNALREQLVRQMGEGWAVDPAEGTGYDDGVVGSFRYELPEEFAATAWFAWLGDYPPLRVDGAFGLSYDRSYRVWPLLSGGVRSELRAPAHDPEGRDWPVELWELDEVGPAVRRLVTPAAAAVSWARSVTSVDAVLDALQADGGQHAQLETIPVLLASAGRPADAKEALAGALRAQPDVIHDEHAAEFVQNLMWWIQGGASIPGRPTGPVRRQDGPPFDKEVAWDRAAQKFRHRREAIEVVARTHVGRSRVELGQMLQEELSERNVPTSPKEVERVVDRMEASTAWEKRRTAWDLLEETFRVVAGVIHEIRTDGKVADSVPEVIRLPSDAVFPVRTELGAWEIVILEETAGVDLEEIFKR